MFIAWLAPELRRLGKFIVAELARGAFVLAALGFAAIAALGGAVYFLNFLTEALAQWMPHWAALLTTAATLLIPAGLAALLALWQFSRMRTVRSLTRTTSRLYSVWDNSVKGTVQCSPTSSSS
ncbi:hypothetical protein JMUB6875_59210 [Nocardia sp. JMUB6875]|uniref:phage holin family protein n=1 Tax=Nocardia sp. JMUB6875 TaxID=3158170 RepID=UPI0032E5A48F